MRAMVLIVGATLLAISAYVWTELPQAREKFQSYLPAHEVTALEARYSPEMVVARYQKQVNDKGSSYEEPNLELVPYLLLEVKYVKDSTSYEGKLLWGLCDGEIVLNPASWVKTHGYDDCLNAHANRNDMRIVHALAQHGGQLDRSGLLASLHQDAAKVDEWLDSCRKKQLITQSGNHWKLHMQRPIFCLEPLTPLHDALVERPLAGAKLIQARYRSAQILELAKAAYGDDFAIKRFEEIYLPVYSLVFKSSDGSKKTLRFNAYSNTLFL